MNTRLCEPNVFCPSFCKIPVARKEACGRIAGFMVQYGNGRTGARLSERYPAFRLRLHNGLQKTLQKRTTLFLSGSKRALNGSDGNKYPLSATCRPDNIPVVSFIFSSGVNMMLSRCAAFFRFVAK